MNRTRLLPEQVANQIAAGEVVERPASGGAGGRAVKASERELLVLIGTFLWVTPVH